MFKTIATVIVIALSTVGAMYLAKKLGLIGGNSIFKRSAKQEVLADRLAFEEILQSNSRIRKLELADIEDSANHKVELKALNKRLEKEAEARDKAAAAAAKEKKAA